MQMNFTGERFVPQLRGQIYYEHLHRYAVSLPLARGKDVLDIASGEGYGAAFLAMAARSVVGVDIDEASVSHAAARYPAMNLSFRAGSAMHIPLADASVDVITSFETIEHLSEHEQMLGEMQRVLRPNGHLVISSPNRLVYSDAHNYSNPFHVRELYFNEFRDLLRTFFPDVHIYGQRIFAACAIHPIDGSRAATRWLGPSPARDTGIPGLPNPEYFVAVCGRNAGAKLPNLSTVYLDTRDDLLADVRSGGLISTGASDFMLDGGAGSPDQKLALIASTNDSSAEESRLKEQVYQLEQAREEQAKISEGLSVECNRLTKQCQELEERRIADNDRLTQECQDIEALRAAEYERLTKQLQELEERRAGDNDRLTKQCQDIEALRAAENERLTKQLQELEERRAGDNDRLTKQCQDIEALRAAENERLTKQCQDLEALRSAEFDSLTMECLNLEALRAAEFERADRAESELRASRRREAEGRLERENLAALPAEVAALTHQVHDLERHRAAEFDRFEIELAVLAQQAIGLERSRSVEFERAEAWRLEAQTTQGNFELLFARSSGLQTALEEALVRAHTAASHLSELQGSKSWRMTAPLRQSATALRK